MQKVTLEIAGVAISFESRDFTLARCLSPFVSRKNPILRVTHSFSPPPSFKRKILFYQRGKSFTFYRTSQGFLIQINPHAFTREFKRPLRAFVFDNLPKAILLDSALQEAVLFLGSGKGKKGSFYLSWPPIYLLLSHLLSHERRGLFIHAAGIYDRKRGILLVGPSGSGKTTLATLFRREGSVAVLGDDFMIVSKGRKEPRIYSTPLFSAFPSFPAKRGAPLKAIFFLAHGRENRLIPLSPRESLRRFLAQTPPIFWVPESFSFSAEFILDLCTKLPTYELSFLPDERAVSFLKRSFSKLK